MINIFAIELLIEKKCKKKKDQEKDFKDQKSNLNVKKLCSTIIITIAIELVLLNIFAYYIEYNRSNYKVIMVQIEKVVESEFIIEYGADHNTYQIFPIAYENEDYYIITRLYCENGRIGIDYDFQSIIRKDGQETIYIQNIYNIMEDNCF